MLRPRNLMGAAVRGLAPAILLGGLTAGAQAQTAPVSAPMPAPSGQQAADPIEPDGTVTVPSFQLPPSAYLSPQARAALPRKPFDPEAMMWAAVAAGKAGELRAKIGEYMAPQISHVTSLYPVTLKVTTLGGVPAVDIKPVTPIPAANANKILLDLPGGGFVMGTANGTGLLESIPLAVMAKVEIISITYRQSPEYKYPASEEDMVAAYRALLKTHRAEDIGIFGCSAGGLLTAESTGWFLKEHLPLPAAIGIFCASADARFDGDSHYYNRPFQALPPHPGYPVYFNGVDMTDPLVSPIFSPAILKQFPPTLIITATRAMDMSSAADTDRELTLAGVDSELHVWDGLGHAFFYNIDLPESREAFSVMASFFVHHLKLTR